MGTLPVSTIIDSIKVLLTEAYAGPPDPRTTWFIDNAPESGLLPLLSRVSAAEASTSVDGSGGQGSTIAANVEHLRWTLANANRTFRGAPWDTNWGESWAKVTMDEAEWDRLCASLRSEFDALLEILGQQDELPGEYLLGVLALIPHAAFHLGLIRQMLERVRNRSTVDMGRH